MQAHAAALQHQLLPLLSALIWCHSPKLWETTVAVPKLRKACQKAATSAKQIDNPAKNVVKPVLRIQYRTPIQYNCSCAVFSMLGGS